MIALALMLMAVEEPPFPDWNCEEPQWQQEMNWCAAQDYRAADEALNSQWTLTSSVMKQRDAEWAQDDGRPGHFATLLEAQRAWLAYRDAHCRAEAYGFRGGSMEPLIDASCKSNLTRERTEQLRSLIEL